MVSLAVGFLANLYEEMVGEWGTETRGILRSMDWFIKWHQAHPIAFELVLFSLACLVSIFSAKIYGFITQWPGRTAQGFRRARAAKQLQQISEIHDNAYQLLLYLATEVFNILISVIFWSVGFWLFSKGEPLKSPLLPIYSGIIAGTVIGKTIDIFQILVHLTDYQQSVAKLNRILGATQKTEQTRIANG